MNPLGIYGAVVYQKSYRSPDGSDLHLILFFPNEIHSDTHHNNGNPVMMSEIAANVNWNRQKMCSIDKKCAASVFPLENP